MRFTHLVIYSCLSLILSACHQKSPKTDYINAELFGHWVNSTCVIDITKANNHYLVTKFINHNGDNFNNLELTSHKDGIIIRFSAKDNTIQFDGSFAEGMLIINKYCNAPLHKEGY